MRREVMRLPSFTGLVIMVSDNRIIDSWFYPALLLIKHHSAEAALRKYDVIVIGAGLMGCFVARHLSQRGYGVVVLERENDVCMGMSRANTAIVYAGYDMKPATLKARLTVEGNQGFNELCTAWGVPYTQTGSLMLAEGPRGQSVLADKLKQGQLNGVPGLRLLDAAQVQSLEPGVSTSFIEALHAPSTGTVNPWQFCLAGAKDALAHGAAFLFSHEVVQITQGYTVHCSNGLSFSSPVIINCSGMHADNVHEMVAPVEFRLVPSSGTYVMLDDTSKDYPQHILFSEPEEKGKGATIVPTVDGTLLLGPSHEKLPASQEKQFSSSSTHLLPDAQYQNPGKTNRDPGYATMSEGLDFVFKKSLEVLPALPMGLVIRSFGTLRPAIHYAKVAANGSVEVSDESIHDFYIAWAQASPGFLDIAGIKTPGLTCADGIGRYAADMVAAYLTDTVHVSQAAPSGFRDTCAPGHSQESSLLSGDLLKESTISTTSLGNPLTRPPHSNAPSLFADEEIICRCRQVSVGEVRAAARTALAAKTVDGIKRRAGCGLGRCQGSFCMERVMLVLAEELGCSPEDILKDREGSWIAGKDREAEGTPHEDKDTAAGKSAVASLSKKKGSPFLASIEFHRDSSLALQRHSSVEIQSRSSVELDGDSTVELQRDSRSPSSHNSVNVQRLGLADESRLKSISLLVIGGGAAGLAAACAAHTAGVASEKILVVDRLASLGGILPQCLHQGFGKREYGGTLSGPEFLAPLLDEFNSYRIPVLLSTMVTSLSSNKEVTLRGKGLIPDSPHTASRAGYSHNNSACSSPPDHLTGHSHSSTSSPYQFPDNPLHASPQGGLTIQPEAIIFATGCRERPPGSLPIAGTRPSGIFTAGAAQRMVNLQGWNVGERIVILGSGDVGMIMAGVFAQQGAEVLSVIEKDAHIGGLAINKERYLDTFGIPLLTNTTITSVWGKRRLEGVALSNGEYLDCDTLIVSVGMIPEVDLLQEVDASSGHPGWLFLAGNARRVHRFIEGVVADGTSAGQQAAFSLLRL